MDHEAWLSLHHFFQETSMITFTPQKQSNDQGLKKAIESERNGGAQHQHQHHGKWNLLHLFAIIVSTYVTLQ
jgi:hypothetical protein